MNRGIIVSGGSFTACQVAVGDGASASNAGALHDAVLAEKLADMARLVSEARLPAERSERLLKAIEVIRTQDPPPRKEARSAMDVLSEAAPAIKGFSALLSAVTAILGAVQ